MRRIAMGAAALAVMTILPAMAQETPAPAADTKLICRRTPEIGSLAKFHRECYTRAEWARIASSQRNGANRLVEDLRTRPDGGGEPDFNNRPAPGIFGPN